MSGTVSRFRHRCNEFNKSRAAQAAGLNCGKPCQVQLASTRMLAHLGYYSDETLIAARRGASEDDQMVARRIESHAHRKASGRATQLRIIALGG